jgi:arginine exporter protein ArgO
MLKRGVCANIFFLLSSFFLSFIPFFFLLSFVKNDARDTSFITKVFQLINAIPYAVT